MEMPSVTVIIPIYNGEPYIPSVCRCLSLQTYRNFDVIFINDGSKDNTPGALVDNLRSAPFVYTIINQKNSGVSAARNAGLQGAYGDYICFVDCDDDLSSDYLAGLVYAVTSTNSDIAVGCITRSRQMLSCGEHRNVVVKKRDDFLKEYLFRGSKYQLPTAIFNRKFIEDNNLSFAIGQKYGEDVHFTWRAYARQKQIAVLEECIYCYNDTPGSATNTLNYDRIHAIELFSELECYIQEYAPSFFRYFKHYGVSRQYWSLLWRAAVVFNDYKSFREYISHFKMRPHIYGLIVCPDLKASLSTLTYFISPYLYYSLVRKIKR